MKPSEDMYPLPKPDLLLLASYPDTVVSALERDFTVHRFPEGGVPADLAGRVRFVATGNGSGCKRETMEALPKLEIVASLGVGYDKVDAAVARERGVRVTNTPDVLNDCVAEVTLALMLALCHRLPQADRYVREGRWEREGDFGLTTELTGRRAGILGLGRIGKEIATRLQAFRMEVVYHGRNRQEHQPYPYYADLTQMAREVEWLVVIAPGSASTRGLVSREVLEALGPEGHLVNVARGSLVDESALIEFLGDGRLGGAALDVFAQEPHVPEALRRLDNVVLLPHQGSATHKTRAAMGDLVVRNLRAHLGGDVPISPVA